MPFVQGQLRQTSLSVTFQSECAHCRRPLQLTIASDLTTTVDAAAAAALVFVPLVDFATLKAKSIIDDF